MTEHSQQRAKRKSRRPPMQVAVAGYIAGSAPRRQAFIALGREHPLHRIQRGGNAQRFGVLATARGLEINRIVSDGTLRAGTLIVSVGGMEVRVAWEASAIEPGGSERGGTVVRLPKPVNARAGASLIVEMP